MRPCIITHRGLDPDRKPYFAESSREAFEDQLERGYGVEFDPLLHEGEFIVAHDSDLSRITRDGCHIISLADLLSLIAVKQRSGISALHLKQRLQEHSTLDALLVHLAKADASQFLIFDVTVDTARYLKKKNLKLMLAPSVAHPYDIERYNNAVGGTLLSIEEALEHRELFDWAWLDEWDRLDKGGGQKAFYTQETFSRFRDSEIKIALVTPELHSTSPGLLGGEAHQDAATRENLGKRMEEIISLNPDAVCTDYPDMVISLIKKKET